MRSRSPRKTRKTNKRPKNPEGFSTVKKNRPHRGRFFCEEGGRGLLVPFRHGKDGFSASACFFNPEQKKNAPADTSYTP